MNPFVRMAALLTALTLVAAACSSDGGDVGASGDVQPDSTVAADDAVTVPTIDVEGPVDPETVRQLASSLLQSQVEGDRLQCMVDDADGDTQLTALYNGFGTNNITPEGFTALTGSVFNCFETQTLATSILPLTGITDGAQISEFTSCIAGQIDAEPNLSLIHI